MTRSSAASKNAAAKVDVAVTDQKAINPDAVVSYEYPDWLERRQEIEDRLKLISVPQPMTAKTTKAPASTTAGNSNKKQRSRRRGGGAKSQAASLEATRVETATNEPQTATVALVPYAPKTDVHWDFVMKELMWLGADFQGERKRQVASAKKLGASIIKFHDNKEKRRRKQLQTAETNRKKLAAKLGRGVKGWWTKLEKIVSYKQKLSSDRERQASMNKQLVKLVQQTEKYTESLSLNTNYTAANRVSTEEEDSEDDDMSTDDDKTRNRKRRRRRRKRQPPNQITIEEALALGAASRRRKTIVDYSRMKLEESEFYGESTADEGSAGSGTELDTNDEEYSPPPSDDEQHGRDETTLEMAMAEEMRARHEQRKQEQPLRRQSRRGKVQLKRGDENDGDDDDDWAELDYFADPEELRKLHEEQEMDIEQVLQRLRKEKLEKKDENEMDIEENKDSDATAQKATKHVHFEEERAAAAAATATVTTSANEESPRPKRPRVDPGEDADDDGDASDVEDYHDALESFGSAMARGKEDADDMEDFHACEPEPDDETTMEAEERLGRDMTYEEEIELLNRENEMSVEELRAMYAGMNNATDDTTVAPTIETTAKVIAAATTTTNEKPAETTTKANETSAADEFFATSDDDGEFHVTGAPEVDDETTMEAEERLGRDMTYEQELELLNRENEMSVEELRAMYAGMNDNVDSGKDEDNSHQAQTTEEYTNDAETNSASDEFFATSDDDGEFHVTGAPEVDDETTMEAEERLGRDMTYEEELTMLNKENEMSVEELRAMYAGMNDGNEPSTEDDDEDDDGNECRTVTSRGRRLTSKIIDNDSSNSDELFSASDDDGEFQVTGAPEIDDETTMEAEERLGRDMTYEQELEMLTRENEMSVEELRAMYAGMNGADEDKNDDDMDEEEDSNNKRNTATKAGLGEGEKKRKREEYASDNSLSGTGKKGTKRSRDGTVSESENDGTAAMKALEASAVKARETLATRPFLLAQWVKLRKYQQVGLNWLVSLQSRRLNGILADGTYAKNNLRELV